MHNNERNVVAACADALFPPDGPIPVSGTQAGLVAYVDAYLKGLPWAQRLLVHLLFAFVQLSPWIFGPRRSRFTRLASADRISVLSDMALSGIYIRRVAFLSLRAILTMGYFACPSVESLITGQDHNKVSP